MKIEILYPETGLLYGDSGNAAYLRCCFPEAEMVYTDNRHTPAFVKGEADLVYMGSMSENNQLLALKRLRQYKEELVREIDRGTFFIFTGNAMELLGQYIETEKGERIQCLGLYDFHADRDMSRRINYLVMGEHEGISIVGNKSQFSFIRGNIDKPFMKVIKGLGNDLEDSNEGIHDRNLYATYVLGPLLVLNPLLTEKIIESLNKGGSLAFRQEVMAAYEARLQEYGSEKLNYKLSEH